MKFHEIPGNETAISALVKMAESGRVPHAVLFYENEGGGGFALASAWVQYLNCEHPENGQACGHCTSCLQMAKMEHPDVHYVFPIATGDVIKPSTQHPTASMALREFRAMALQNPFFKEQDVYEAIGVESKSGLISVYDAKEIIDVLSLAPVQNGYKAVIMYLPERMNAAAANKLLKLLEEPPAKTLFMLVTDNPEDIMTTIFSRCQAIRVLPFSKGDALAGASIPEEMQEICNRMLKALSRKDLASALDCADEVAAVKSREKQKSFCIFASRQVRRIFMYLQKLEDIAYFDGVSDEDLKGISGTLSPAFCSSASQQLDRAAMLIGRNVNAKMVFTDLVNRLYVKM